MREDMNERGYECHDDRSIKKKNPKRMEGKRKVSEEEEGSERQKKRQTQTEIEAEVGKKVR